ncbi:MAG: hypothetical protein HEQ40_17290 [Lacibacter sp.]|jgi:hypothetical protein
MFSQTWKKYLPLLTMFLKKSANGPQTIQLNQTDFERALGGRKLKLSFSRMEINKGRMNNLLKNTALAKELADVLLDDAVTGSLLRTRNISFSFNGNCELTITDETPIAVESDNLAEIADSEAND